MRALAAGIVGILAVVLTPVVAMSGPFEDGLDAYARRARFDELDLQNLRLRIPQAKAGVRDQPITPELAEVLAKERAMASDPDGWIFPTARPNLSAAGRRTNMSRSFKRAVVRAGLVD